MDFKEDQLAIEAYVRMRSGWLDMDEISEDEYSEYAMEYMDENPFPAMPVVNGLEVVIYDRCSGEFLVLRSFPGIPFCWQPGYFWHGVRMTIFGFRQNHRENPSKIRLLAEYFGLIEVANED